MRVSVEQPKPPAHMTTTINYFILFIYKGFMSVIKIIAVQLVCLHATACTEYIFVHRILYWGYMCNASRWIWNRPLCACLLWFSSLLLLYDETILTAIRQAPLCIKEMLKSYLYRYFRWHFIILTLWRNVLACIVIFTYICLHILERI